MKIIIILILLGTLTLAEEGNCSCQRFTKEQCNELFLFKKCGWFDDKNPCLDYFDYQYKSEQQAKQTQQKIQEELEELEQSTQPYSVYCEQFQEDQELCSKTDGCAYYDGKCIQFPGCSIFDIISCQQSSTKCHNINNSCVEYKHCEKLHWDECGKINHINGVAESCEWQNERCIEKECKVAPHEYYNQCGRYLNKCYSSIKEGKYVGCLEIGCKYYKSNSKLECTNITTLEGQCNKSNLGTSCYGPGDCRGIADSQDTCEQFGDDCLYNGKACQLISEFKSCNEQGDNCDPNSIGLEGKCKIGIIQSGQNIFTTCYSEIQSRFFQVVDGCVDKKQCYLINTSLECNESKDCHYSKFHCVSISSDCTQYTDKAQMCKDNQECQYISYQQLRQKCEGITDKYYCLQNRQLDYLNCVWTAKQQCEVAKQCSELKECNLFINCFYLQQIQGCVQYSVCENYDITYCQFMNDNNCMIKDNQCVTKQCADHQDQKECEIHGCQYVENQCYSKQDCESYKEKKHCLTDQNNISCIWNQSLQPKCQQFQGCTNLKKQSIAECQSYSNYCTYQPDLMGLYCQVKRRCFMQDNYCKSETNEQCGMRVIKDESICQLFTQCSDSQGTNFDICQKWSNTCTTNGKQCTPFSDRCSDYNNKSSCVIDVAKVKCQWEEEQCNEKCTKSPKDNQFDQNCKSELSCQMSDCKEQCYLTPHNCSLYLNTCEMYLNQENCYKSKQNTCFWSNGKCIIMNDCFQAKEKKYCDNDKCLWNEVDNYCQELSCNLIGLQVCNQTIIYGYQYTEQCKMNSKQNRCVVKVPKDDVECYLMSDNLSVMQKQCVSCGTKSVVRTNPLKINDKN